MPFSTHDNPSYGLTESLQPVQVHGQDPWTRLSRILSKFMVKTLGRGCPGSSNVQVGSFEDELDQYRNGTLGTVGAEYSHLREEQ